MQTKVTRTSGRAHGRGKLGRDLRGRVDEHAAELDLDEDYEKSGRIRSRGGRGLDLRGRVDVEDGWFHRGPGRRGRQGGATRRRI